MNTAAIQALKGLQDRAKTGIVFSATQGQWLRFERWKMLHKGIADAILILTNAKLASRLTNPYLPPSHLQAAWAALPDNIDDLTLRDVVNLCRTQGVGVADNRVTEAYLEFIEKLVHDEAVSGLTDIDDEQPVAGVDGRDGSCDLHASLPDAVFVVEGLKTAASLVDATGKPAVLATDDATVLITRSFKTGGAA